MSLTLYWGSGSPYSWRCQLVLALKNVPYESRLLEFSKKEHKSPEMLALNPRGKVPVLVDGDTVVYESLAIVAYLEAKHPRPPLFGTSPEQAALIWQLVSEYENYFYPAARPLVSTLFGASVEREVVEKSVADARTELSRLDDRLSRAPWLAGSEISAADVWLYPSTMYLDRMIHKQTAAADLIADWRESFPALSTWQKRFLALPGVEATTPPHWKS